MATPTLVQHCSTANARNTAFGPVATALTVRFPHPTLAGNLLIASVMAGYGTSPTITCADDKGNTYTAGPTVDDTTNGQKVALFYCANATAGVVSVTFSFSQPSNFYQGTLSEFYNVATTTPADGSNGTAATSATWSAGSFTPAVDGDLIYNIAWQISAFPSGLTSLSPAANFTLLNASKSDGHAAQYLVQTTHAAINPAITANASKNYLSLAIAFKNATAGTAPSGPRIIRRCAYTFPTTEGGTGFTEFFPCDTGHLLVAAWDGYSDTATPCHLSAVTDSQGNGWTVTSPTDSPDPKPGTSQLAYTSPALLSTSLSITTTLSTSAYDTILVVWELSGLLDAPFDTLATNSDSDNNDEDVVAVTITPTRAGGIVLLMGQVALGCVVDVTADNSTAYFDCATWPEEQALVADPMEQDNARAHCFPTAIAPITFTWTMVNVASGAGAFSVQAISFLAPPPAPITIGSGFQKTHRPAPFRPGLAR